MNCEFEDNILTIQDPDFNKTALEIFKYQYHHNKIYRQFADVLRINAEQVRSIYDIPFLPIGFFKSHVIKTNDFSPEYIFESSGTTQSVKSLHFVKKLSLYRKSFVTAFTEFYGEPEEWCIIGLLPSYLERQHSSLVMMVDELITMSKHPASGFYLDEHEKLYDVLQELEKKAQKCLLIGVTFGLLDFADKYSLELRNTVVMETGGMKGRREEMTREEVHEILKTRLGVQHVHSEYGMTELLSQAYATANGIFRCPAWMKVLVREEDDPLKVNQGNEFRNRHFITGVLNIIDLANIHSCAFIATDDVGRLYADGSFEVLGRMDSSDIRGCSLMVV